MRRGTVGSRLAAVALVVVLLAAAYVVIGVPLHSAYNDANSRIAASRLQITAAQRQSEDRAAAANALRESGGEGTLLLAERSDASAAATLQTRLQAILESNAAQLVSVEALPATDVDGYRAVRIRVQFSTGHLGLPRILHALESTRPVAILDNLTINARSARVTGIERPLDVRIDVTAFRAADG